MTKRFLVRTVEVLNRNNPAKTPYLKLTLVSQEGAMTAKVWDNVAALQAVLTPGEICDISGDLKAWNGVDELVVTDAKAVQNADLGDVLPTCPKDRKSMWQTLLGYLAQIACPTLRRVAARIVTDPGFEKQFTEATGAKGIHHAYVGGLLEHTLGVVEISRDLARRTGLDVDFATLVAFLHDIGKIESYALADGFDMTAKGRLLGHTFLGAQRIAKILEGENVDADLANHILHCVLSHHGKTEWGAVTEPATPMALLVHQADLADAQLAQALTPLASTPAGNWTTQKVPGIGRTLWNGPTGDTAVVPLTAPAATGTHGAP